MPNNRNNRRVSQAARDRVSQMMRNAGMHPRNEAPKTSAEYLQKLKKAQMNHNFEQVTNLGGGSRTHKKSRHHKKSKKSKKSKRSKKH